jgi:hypothetical protein
MTEFVGQFTKTRGIHVFLRESVPSEIPYSFR